MSKMMKWKKDNISLKIYYIYKEIFTGYIYYKKKNVTLKCDNIQLS